MIGKSRSKESQLRESRSIVRFDSVLKSGSAQSGVSCLASIQPLQNAIEHIVTDDVAEAIAWFPALAADSIGSLMGSLSRTRS